MKKMMIILALALAGCSTMKVGSKSAYCLYLDDVVGFARCETTETICYATHGGQTCYLKPQPIPSPLPTDKK